MTSCLTCKFLDEPAETHKWHWCLWKKQNPMPLAIVRTEMVPINTEFPFTNCPVWEQR